MARVEYGEVSLERMVRAVEKVRERLLRAAAALEKAGVPYAVAGFVHRHAAGIDMFLDGPKAKARDAVHVVFAGEKVREESLLPAPDVAESEATPQFRVVGLEALVRMKLTAFEIEDRMLLHDMIGVGLVDATWLDRFPPPLAARLKELLDNPEG